MRNLRYRKNFFRILAAVLVVGAGCRLAAGQWRSTPAFSYARAEEQTLVIDAGHGGEDGGAVSISGVPESGINLAIALKLDHLMGLYGVETRVLRTSDISLHDSSAATLREKKVSDLHNRVAMIEETQNATLVSIHQNTFSSAKYHGAQVFYANGELSQSLAKLTQETLRLTLDLSNTRVPAKIPDTVYLMNHISCRAILVECGFLSNAEEDLKLQSSTYQTKIASALAGAYLQFTEGEQPNEG